MRIASSQPLLLVAAIFLVSCDRPAIDPSQSLVGAKELPPAKLLSRESIYLSRGFPGVSGWLSYELKPDNTLIVAHTVREPAREIVRGKETFRLDAKIAAQVRLNLWRLRPEVLKGIEWAIRPTGCGSPLHDNPEFSVLFIAEGPKPGVEDDHTGLSLIPDTESCNNRQAIEARTVIRKVIGSFPHSKVAANFERALTKS